MNPTQTNPVLGFLGCGNMGAAAARGAVASRLAPAADILIYDANPEAVDPLEALGCRAMTSPSELFRQADVVVLAVKPQVFREVAAVWKNELAGHPRTTVVSVMAGISLRDLRKVFPASFTCLRVMPNLGLAAGQGATAIAVDDAPEEALETVERIFRASGETARVAEELMDAVTALSGSGPMYVFEFVEALTRGGVAAGLPRETAYRLALQTVKGGLALLESSSDEPPAWTRRVCSPGGTTLAALGVLEQGGFTGLVEKAVQAAAARSRELSG